MILTQSQLEQLFEQARRDAPYETCGVIFGKDERAQIIHPLQNVHEHPQTRYRPDDQELFAAVNEFEYKQGYELLAIYHSHPATRAYPSKTDLKESGLYNGSNVIFIIMSLMNPDAPEAHAYLLNGETITETPLKVIE